MTGEQIQLPLYEGASERRGGEDRLAFVRGVELCRFPRVGAEEGLHSGFTRDVSKSGMCLRVTSAEREGTLLRVVVNEIDGRRGPERIVRVAWCRPMRPGNPGGYLVGVAFVQSAPVRVHARTLEPAAGFEVAAQFA